MHQAVLAGQNRYERTEINDSRNLALVQPAHFRFGSDRIHHVQRCVAGICIFTINANVSVVININRSTRLFGDAANDRSAFADDVANLVRVNLNCRHGRRIFRHRWPRF